MIPAGISYPGLRVIPPPRQVAYEGAAYRDSIRDAALLRTGFKGFGGLGSTRRRQRACVAKDVLHAGGMTASTYIPKSTGGGVDVGGIVQGVSTLLDGVLNATACAQDVSLAQNTLTPDPNSGNAQMLAAMAQQNQQLMMLMAQQNQQRATPPPATDHKQMYMIAGGVAAAVVLVILLK